MYLSVSLLVIAGLVVGIATVIWRKLSYLKKLPVDSNQPLANYWLSDFFPELRHYWKELDLRSYQVYFLRETEKFLRRLRLLSLKLESFSNSLLNKIKSSGHYLNHQNGQNKKEEPVKFPAEILPVSPAIKNGVNYKQEEQTLILEIARDPKNAALYRRLAEIYFRLKNFTDAKESLETALKLDPEDETTKEKLEKAKAMLPT